MSFIAEHTTAFALQRGKPVVARGISRRKLLSFAAGTAALGPSMVKAALSVSLSRDLLGYDALGLAQLIRDRQVSPREVLQAAIARIESMDSTLNAMTTLTFDRALEKSARIPRDSVFAGVPTLFKDLVDVGGVRRTSGSKLFLANVPKASVEYVKAVEASGLNMLGMTNTPELASLALTDNPAFGPTLNPWNLEYSAGGSSGGSAAAVAAGYVPLAHGTDGGGSNRIPASCCGVLGMKASRYRMVSGEPDGGHLFLRTHQCLSRSVRDSAALLAATENRQNQAGYAPVGLVTAPGKRRLRIAYSVKNCFGELPDAAVHEVLDRTATLCARLGHEVEEVANPLDGEALFTAVEAIMLVGMPGLLGTVEALTGRPAEEAGLLSPATVAMGRYGARYSREDYDRSIAYCERLALQFGDFFSGQDIWLTPVMPMETPGNGWVGPNSTGDELVVRNRRMLAYTAVANAIGAPAMSVPLFHSPASGLPVGSHFMAAPGADRTLYELAYELEEAQPWAGRWAPISAKHAPQTGGPGHGN
jgi:amidase